LHEVDVETRQTGVVHELEGGSGIAAATLSGAAAFPMLARSVLAANISVAPIRRRRLIPMPAPFACAHFLHDIVAAMAGLSVSRHLEFTHEPGERRKLIAQSSTVIDSSGLWHAALAANEQHVAGPSLPIAIVSRHAPDGGTERRPLRPPSSGPRRRSDR
jgi:hypothetical protein